MSLNFPAGTHIWKIEEVMEMLEEHPEYESMSDAELKQKASNLYWEASGLFDKGNRLEADADTIEFYVQIRGVEYNAKCKNSLVTDSKE